MAEGEHRQDRSAEEGRMPAEDWFAVRELEPGIHLVCEPPHVNSYQCHLVKNWMQNGQDGLVAASDVARLFHREGAAFVFLDDAGVRPFAAAFTDSFEDFPDRHDPRVLEPAGGKMPPGL